MAEECGESTTLMVSSSTPPNWWHDLHGTDGIGNSSSNISAAWHHHHPPNPTSSTSTADEDASMSISSYTNTSNSHSIITNESASHPPLVEPNVLIPGHFQDNHLLLSPLLCGGGSMSKLNNSNNNNLLMESKGVLDPAFDYLKKWDNSNCSWEDITPERMAIDVDRERVTDLVSNGSILFPPQTCSMSLGTSTSLDQATSSGFVNLKQMLMSDTASNSSRVMVNGDNNGNYDLMMSPFKRHAFKEEYENLEMITTSAPFCGLSRIENNNNNNNEFPFGMKVSSQFGGYGITSPAYPRIKNHEDGAPSFITSRFNANDSQDSSSISDSKRRNGFLASPPIRVNVRGPVHTTEGKKRRVEETSDAVLKKTKTNNINNESTTAVSPSVKMQAPKAKLGDKITALQQIVSPFGKTDTASVLMEAIAYIKCLQEQVQLLVSNPYLKINPHKNYWIGMDIRKNNKEEMKIDLRSKGLCLMPISCTPQIYRDTNAGSDYWTPPYRGMLYRPSNC